MSKLLRAGLASALLVLSSAAVSTGAAQADPRSEIQTIIADQLQSDPGGLVVGNKIYYPGETVFVAMEAGVLSLSNCPSNYFCLWQNANYTGTFITRSGSGVTHNLSGSFNSGWNNRTRIARLYNSTGSAYTCFAAGAKRSTLATAYKTPDKVYLASATSC